MGDIESKQFGGLGGQPFDDTPIASGPISHVQVATNNSWVTGLAAYYGSSGNVAQGGFAGTTQQIDLASGERLIAIFGRSGNYVDQIGFVSLTSDNQAKVHGPFGGTGGSPFLIAGEIERFFGRAGNFIDAIGVWIKSPAD